MCQDSEVAFAVLGLVASSAQRRTEEPFVPRDRAFGLPSVIVDTLGKALLHLPSVLGRGTFVARTPLIQGDHRGADAESLSAEAMIVLAVVGGVGQKPIPAHVAGGLEHGFGELRGVVRGTSAGNGARNQVGPGVTNDGQLGPAKAAEMPVALALHVVGAGVPGLKTRGVNGALGTLVDQAQAVGAPECGCKQLLESPFFSSRFSA